MVLLDSSFKNSLKTSSALCDIDKELLNPQRTPSDTAKAKLCATFHANPYVEHLLKGPLSMRKALAKALP